ncbi:hypothetical protein [Burkholderia gladioli]|uniref:hypothetical protein n=1 Tax=Burkholderia gladioli TaxID=28095 RepID=UPI00163EAFB3|nr:hypothetical protein [Burkholderia gladioli]
MIDVNGLRGDMVIRAVLRSDLSPIPLTFEGTIRSTTQTATDYQGGKLIKVNEVPFRIVKSVPITNAGGGMQGTEPISGNSIIAYPDALVEVAKPRRSAVVFQNGTLGGIYRACGATAPLSGDFGVDRFACLIGGTPTIGIAQVLQEASAVVMWRSKKLQAMNLRDLFKQTPVDNLDFSSSEDIDSDFLQADEVPVYFSTGPDGGFVAGRRTSESQSVVYTPRKSAHTLNAMGRVLMRKKVIMAQADPTVQAGNIILIRGVPYAAITVAQVMQNGSDGGSAEQYTRIWLGVST